MPHDQLSLATSCKGQARLKGQHLFYSEKPPVWLFQQVYHGVFVSCYSYCLTVIRAKKSMQHAGQKLLSWAIIQTWVVSLTSEFHKSESGYCLKIWRGFAEMWSFHTLWDSKYTWCLLCTDHRVFLSCKQHVWTQKHKIFFVSLGKNMPWHMPSPQWLEQKITMWLV